ncbi:MAG: hypothetical protein M3Q81_04045 [bacterium]|nr:hypothetical protein [bacterium]
MLLSAFNELLLKPVTRKEFLLHLGVLLLMITGVSGLLKTLADPNVTTVTSTKHKNGFGSGPYGV